MTKQTQIYVGIGIVAVAIAAAFYFRKDVAKIIPRGGGLTPEATAIGINKALASNKPLSAGTQRGIAFLEKKGYVKKNNQMVKA